MIDDRTIRQWWAIFRPDNALTEIRLLGDKATLSGYFTDVEKVIAALQPYADAGYGIYATLNEIKPECYSRTQRDKLIKTKTTTSDTDILRRTVILVDIDPQRASDTNASEPEKAAALSVARNVYAFLRGEGFSAPVVADSANGYHLLYRVALPNSPESLDVVRRFLLALDMLFSNDACHIDTSVYNAARIAKLIGTKSNKGSDTPERPQRMSRFLTVPKDYVETKIAYLRKVADMLPAPEHPETASRFSAERFDLDGFIAQHGIEVLRRTRFSAGTKYVLKECPFDRNHKDAAVFALDNGAYAFKCFHASCQQYHWRDFRLHYDPQAYDRKAYDEYNRKRRYNAPVRQEDIKPVPEDDRGKKWLEMGDIRRADLGDVKAIPTGIPEVDKKTLGLILGETTVLTGGAGSGKTTLLDHLLLTAVQRDYKVALWSGEMPTWQIASWIAQQAAGRGFVEPIPGTEGLYGATRQARRKIDDWLAGKLKIYNNDYGRKWSQLSADIAEVVEQNGINLVLVDNLMCVDIDNFTGENNDRQKAFINDLSALAKKANCHIVLVAHPRKENLNQLIRKESISGSSDITNLAFNVMLVHRVGRDFEKRGAEFFGPHRVQELMGYDLVLELNKMRTSGVQDLLVGLYYEKETRRIKNDLAESIVYGWNDTPVQAVIEDMPDFGLAVGIEPWERD